MPRPSHPAFILLPLLITMILLAAVAMGQVARLVRPREHPAA